MSKNALIVGGSKGIGAALVKKMINSSTYDQIIILSRTKPDFEGDYTYISTDVSEDNLPDLDLPIDALAYCPGSINLKPFKGLKHKDFSKDLEINLLSAIKVLQKYQSNLQQTEAASVVLFSTVAVQTGMPFHASIAAAKGAVEGLTRSLAAEWSPKIRVNAIAPSLTQTDLAARLLRNEKQLDAASQRHPLKRIGQAEDVANLAQFLLSDESSWITGLIHQIDGGMSGIRKF
ncbi:MAG: SDR family oxidoreductase [Aureispira sp.]|nr:SDR family oxidoreductase [Aureispira sp.]